MSGREKKRASPMEIIYRGAEADVFLGAWGGEDAVFKFRKRLSYRLPELDDAIRSQRTLREADLLHASKAAGVRTPFLYYVSAAESLIVMERVEGPRLKSVLDSEAAFDADGEKTRKLSCAFGAAVGRLHAAGIMHGDLTTSNVIVAARPGGGVCLIDFGLAVRTVRVEDHAVDIRLIKETMVGAHSEISDVAMRSFLVGYSNVLGTERVRAVTSKLLEIERRGRYARVE